MKSTSTLLARAIFAASLFFTANSASAEEVIGCEERCVEGLPSEAPREGTVITIDVSTNQAYLFEDGELIMKSAAATGTDKVLKRGRRFWLFRYGLDLGPNEMLKAVYKAAEVGTDVYIFDSGTGTLQTAEKHSDLDYLKD